MEKVNKYASKNAVGKRLGCVCGSELLCDALTVSISLPAKVRSTAREMLHSN